MKKFFSGLFLADLDTSLFWLFIVTYFITQDVVFLLLASVFFITSMVRREFRELKKELKDG